MSTSVASVTSHFPDAENGFTTTTSGSVSSGAATVGLNSTAGYTNGEPVVMVIDPSNSKKQTFTGIIDTSGNQVTGVVWTAGTNVGHDAGATVVDYATATHIAMISKGIKVEHNQDGTHDEATITSRTEDTAPVTGDFLLTYDASALALKKAQLGNVTPYKADKSVLTTDSNPYKFYAYRNAAWTSSNGSYAKVAFDAELFDTNANFDSTTNNRYVAPVAGFYYFAGTAGASVTDANFAGVALFKNGSTIAQGNQTVVGGTNNNYAHVSGLLQLAASDYVELYHIGSGGAGVTGSTATWFSGYLVSRT